jgi:hypothetical protein
VIPVESAASDRCPYCGGETTENPASPHPYCPACFRYIVPDPDLSARVRRDEADVSAGRSPPLGIKIVCSLWSVGSFLGIALGILLLQAAVEVQYPLFVWLGVIQAALGALQLVSVYGLWKLRPWGWRTAVVLLWISLASGVLLLFAGDAVALLPMASSIAFLVYFHRKRELYG